MSSRNRRFFDADDDDDDVHEKSAGVEARGWSRSRRTNGTITRDRRNGVSRDPLSEVRAVVEDDWKETLDDDFHPITLALDMLDTSSLGRARELEHFTKTNLQIEQALQSTVNEHFQGFNASVGTYGLITGAVNESKRQVRSTRDALLRAKVQLSSKRTDLLDMSAKSGQYQGMIKLLRQISALQKLPEELEAQLSSKHFLQAVETLSNATNMANRDELSEIPALNDLRQSLRAQAVGLVEILVEELHNHLYLKSPYCDGRWAAYVNGQSDLPVVASDRKQEPGEKKARKHSTIGRLELEQHQIRQIHDDLMPIAAEARHPEIDSLRYIVILTQSLSSMGKLPYALEIMDQRVPLEIAQVVARTKSEVKARHRGLQISVLSVEDSLNSEALDNTVEPLRDLLWTLFSKWDAMLQAHRALYDAVSSFSEQQFGEKTPSQHAGVYDFSLVWQPLENELKSLLSEYLTLKNDQVLRKEDNRAWNPLFSNRPGDSNSLFRISEAHLTRDQSFTLEEHELREMLQSSVPGLLSEKSEHLPKSEIVSRETTLQQLKLAPSSPFNITAVLQPTLSFLNRAKRIVPHSSTPTPSSLAPFLDEFLEATYYPQLAETVDALYRKVIESKHITPGHVSNTGVQKFQLETDGLLQLIDRLGSLLSSIPYRQSVFAQTVLGIVANYYQKCVSWLGHLSANEFPDAHLGALKLGSSWANRSEIRDLWQTYDYETVSEVALYEALTTETAALFKIKHDFTIRSEDLLQDPSQFQSLVSLYQAVKKFEKDIRRFQLSTDTKTQRAVDFSLEAHTAFGKLLLSWQSLGRSILVVIRMELRAHVLFYLQIILGQGNYNIEEKANEVDSFVVDLNSDILAICTILRATSASEYRFLMAGLAKLINEVLIEDSSTISIMTKHGAEKLTLGISALQQNLRNLVPDPAEADLSRAAKFYSHFQLGPRGLTEQAGSDASFDFTRDQAVKLLTLMYSIDLSHELVQRSSNRDSISAKRRQLNEHIDRLSSQLLTVG